MTPRRPNRDGSRARGTLPERFWRRVRIDSSAGACWLWSGTKNENGYGVIGRGGRGRGLCKAHRVSWEIHRGPIPDGMFVLHGCDTPGCVNPEHLRLGTAADNMADCRRRHRSVHVTPGFTLSLNLRQVEFIRDAYAAGFSRARLADVFGISGTSVARYVRGVARRIA